MPPAMPTSIWPSAILSATWMAACRPVPQACWMSVAGVSGRQPRAEHGLAGQVEVARVLEHRAGDDLAEPLALQAEAGDQAVDGRGQHLLVGDVGVDGVGPGERDAVAAEDGDAAGREFMLLSLPATPLANAMSATSRSVDAELHHPLHDRRTLPHVTGGPPAMSDRYQGFVSSPIGKLLVKNLGLPSPTASSATARATRWSTARSLVGGEGRLAKDAARRPGRARHRLDDHRGRGRAYKALVFDATGITDTAGLVALQRVLHPPAAQPRDLPARRRARHPARAVAGEERVAQRALEGFTRSLGKEIGRGGTVQLVYVAEGAEGAVGVDAGLPPLPQVGVRLRARSCASAPTARPRPSRSPTGAGRWRARSRS